MLVSTYGDCLGGDDCTSNYGMVIIGNPVYSFYTFNNVIYMETCITRTYPCSGVADTDCSSDVVGSITPDDPNDDPDPTPPPTPTEPTPNPYPYDPTVGTQGSHIITTEVTKPCIKTVLNSIINPASSTFISRALTGIFNSSSGNINLEFDEAYSTPRGTNVTNPPTLDANGITSTIQIELLRTDLDPGSQEYKAAAILHEIFHAIMETNSRSPIDQLDQHAFMVQNYTKFISDELKLLFPSMGSDTANALALGGYWDLETYSAASLTDKATELGLTMDQVHDIDSHQHNGLAGTICN